jgi:hypothetical protein
MLENPSVCVFSDKALIRGGIGSGAFETEIEDLGCATTDQA